MCPHPAWPTNTVENQRSLCDFSLRWWDVVKKKNVAWFCVWYVVQQGMKIYIWSRNGVFVFQCWLESRFNWKTKKKSV
jgi:hypothetical protein